MASAIPGLRFVRCPKCKNILIEFAGVPIYKCRVCDTALQSKHCRAAGENITDAPPQEISSQNQPDSSSFDQASASRNEITVGAHDAASPSPQASNMDAPAEGAGLKHEESCSKDGGSGMKSNEETPSEDKENRNVLRSNSNLSHASDGSRKRISLEMSRRTFRQRKAQDSEDAVAQKGEATREQDIPQPSKENPDAINRLNSDAKECSQEEKDHAAIDTSLDAKDLVDSENHGPPESPSKDAQVRQGSAKTPKNGSVPAKLRSLGSIQRKILRKVDELREEINEIFEKSDEGKGRPQCRGIPEEIQIKNLDSGFARRPPRPRYQRMDIPKMSRFADSPSGLHHTPCRHCQHATAHTSYPNGFCTDCHHGMNCRPSANCSPIHHRLSPARCHDHGAEHENGRPHDRERRQQKKRPCRPVLGGSPFVICYNCLELLKLPIEFLVANKRLYKLQCGACSKVLTYSFRSRNQGMPDTPNEVETPTTEVEESIRSSSSSSSHEMLNARMNEKSQWDPVSYSEEHGLSLGISYSTDTELPEQMPISSRAMVKKYSKLKSGSELHMLMGYGSASDILYRHSEIDEESEMTEATTPLCNTPDSAFGGDIMKRTGTCISDPSTSRNY